MHCLRNCHGDAVAGLETGARLPLGISADPLHQPVLSATRARGLPGKPAGPGAAQRRAAGKHRRHRHDSDVRAGRKNVPAVSGNQFGLSERPAPKRPLQRRVFSDHRNFQRPDYRFAVMVRWASDCIRRDSGGRHRRLYSVHPADVPADSGPRREI